jgi:hypothetical protein
MLSICGRLRWWYGEGLCCLLEDCIHRIPLAAELMVRFLCLWQVRDVSSSDPNASATKRKDLNSSMLCTFFVAGATYRPSKEELAFEG